MTKQVITVIIFFLIQGLFHNIGHPVTPAFVRSLEIPDVMFGVFFATMSLGLMIGGPIWGVLGDRSGKRTFVVLGILIYSLGQLGFGYAGSTVLMVFFRFMSGFGAAAPLTLLTAHVIEHSTPQTRARHLALMAGALTAGASLGYGLGGFLSTNADMQALFKTTSLPVIFLIQSILNALYAGIVLVFLEAETKNANHADRPSFLTNLKNASLIRPSLLLFLVSLTLMTIGSINVSKYLDVFIDELGYSPQDLGTFVMVTGFVSILASVLIVPFFAKLKRQRVAISVIQALSAIVIFYVFRASDFMLAAYTVFMAYVILKTVYQPLEQNHIASFSEEGKYATTMGVRQSFVSIGMVIGPLSGGFLYEIRPRLVFDVSALMFLLGIVFILLSYRLHRKEEKAKFGLEM
ncbi:MAG: MFS transporter [Acholeplasmataceae bacterium]|nr:MFS transporter [Acholeplasmataceae bacterium]